MNQGTIAVSTSPATASGVAAVCASLEQAAFVTTTFPADGIGGRAMEAAILAGAFMGVLDFTLAELACDRLGLPGGAGPDRLTAAAIRGIPQVIVPGGLDGMLTPKIADALAKEIAEKACAARGPTAIVLPRIDADDAVKTAFADSLQVWLYGVELVELPFKLDEPEFAVRAAAVLLRLLGRPSS